MKRIMQITLAAAIVTSAVSPVRTQERQQGSRFYFREAFYLLTQESVQKELKLADEQIKKIKELQKKQRDDLSNDPSLSRLERLRKFAKEHIKAENELIDDLLKPEQVKRVNQISMQAPWRSIPYTLTNKEIVKELKITDEQRKKIKEIQAEAVKEVIEAGIPISEERRKEIQAKGKLRSERAMAVLTTEQKAKWKEMQGEPFKGELASPFRSGSRNQENQGSRK